MNLKFLSLSVFAALPLLICAQEAKLVNCRTLEAAGNFVAPDEVVDGDRVCQKLKPGVVDPTKLAPSVTTTTVQPATGGGATATPTARVRRDAPVAPGTPSVAPERDYGFSDANAVESAPPVAPAGPQLVNQNSERTVQMGAFDKAGAKADDATLPKENTDSAGRNEGGLQEGQRTECTQNITLGSLRDSKLALGTPGWAEKWIEKNQKRISNVCFSATPMRGARNYLIVFYIVATNEDGPGKTSAAIPIPEGTGMAAEGAGAFSTKGGSAWHYASERNVGVTDAAKDVADESHEQPGRICYGTAYTEEGVAVAERWPEQPKEAVKMNRAASEEQERVSEELLSGIVEDVRKL